MTRTLQRLLFAIAASLVVVDLAWGWLGNFHVDVAAYGRLALLGLALAGGGMFYQTRRPEPALAAMLLSASFLVFFSAAANLLNNYLLTVAGTRIDAQLDAIDRALGFDWYRMMLAMADHPLFNTVLFHAYNLALPEIALVMVMLAWMGKPHKTYRFCIAVAAGALITIFLWALHPAFGAMSLYTLPADVANRLTLSLTGEFGKAQVALLRDGPGYITLDGLHGSLIGFPSYHAALALILTWYARSLPRPVFWPLLLLNILVVVATPVQGGHHLVDVLASFPVAALSLYIAAGVGRRRQPEVMVKERPRIYDKSVIKAVFRFNPAHASVAAPDAIKSKLSGVP